MKSTKISRSDDATAMLVFGDKTNPEPTLHVIQFPGGHVEVSRCSDGQYWSHIHLHHCTEITDSRVSYDYEGSQLAEAQGIKSIHEMPLQNHIVQLAVKVRGPFSHDILKAG